MQCLVALFLVWSHAMRPDIAERPSLQCTKRTTRVHCTSRLHLAGQRSALIDISPKWRTSPVSRRWMRSIFRSAAFSLLVSMQWPSGTCFLAFLSTAPTRSRSSSAPGCGFQRHLARVEQMQKLVFCTPSLRLLEETTRAMAFNFPLDETLSPHTTSRKQPQTR